MFSCPFAIFLTFTLKASPLFYTKYIFYKYKNNYSRLNYLINILKLYKFGDGINATLAGCTVCPLRFGQELLTTKQIVMKKIFSIMMAAAITFAFTACEGTDPDNGNDNGTEQGGGLR